MRLWQLGNTSVRSAMRIRDGLVALSSSPIQGNIRGSEGDISFRHLLGECGVVSLGEDSTNSVGRKWRSAMGKLGFIYPEVQDAWGFTQEDLGQIDMITPAGWSLIRAETVPAMQECYLRAMSTPLFPTDNRSTFSPLCWTLALLLELEQYKAEPSISFLEMASLVQTTNPVDGLSKTVARILDLRNRRKYANSKASFDREILAQAAASIGCKPHTLNDYADMNIRYLKAANVVQSRGKGIAIIPEKYTLAQALARHLLSNKPSLELYRSLCNGSKLPTDSVKIAQQVLEDLLRQAMHYGITYSITGRPLDTPAEINQICFDVESLIAEKREEFFAKKQVREWQEIAAYMDLLVSRRFHLRLSRESEISIPKTEAPAYLEWCLWRAFLAIDNLENKPYDVRRFKIDHDFLPVCTAPGNGPDLIAEFKDCVVVIEVTLSGSSRQEAMEGESVRRHIAELVQQYHKPVYGLFVANNIDSNTAETFRTGVWYSKDDVRLKLQIIPLTLAQFSSFFKAIFSDACATPQALVSLLNKCECCRHKHEAPLWKEAIAEIVKASITNHPSNCH